MKTLNLARLASRTVFVTGLLASSASLAMVPVQRAARGTIENIDHDGHELIVTPPNGGQSLVFHWNDSTRFRQSGLRTCSQALCQGSTVKIYYRRESAQLVLREVRLLSHRRTRCGTHALNLCSATGTRASRVTSTSFGAERGPWLRTTGSLNKRSQQMP